MAETYLLAIRCPVYRRRDSHLGSCMELENLVGDAKEKAQAAQRFCHASRHVRLAPPDQLS